MQTTMSWLESFVNETCDSTDPSFAEVLALLDKVLKKDPQLFDFNGFPLRAVTFLTSSIQGVNALATALAGCLDQRSFKKFSNAVAQITSPSNRQGFSFQEILKPSSPWHAATMAVLSSPKVRLSPAVQTAARLAGLGQIVNMWESAQSRRGQFHK